MPPLTVKVDRTTEWGNPFRIGEPVLLPLAHRWGWKIRDAHAAVATDAAHAVRLFTQALAFDESSHWLLRQELRGKDLACWCSLSEPCHADVLLEVANR